VPVFREKLAGIHPMKPRKHIDQALRHQIANTLDALEILTANQDLTVAIDNQIDTPCIDPYSANSRRTRAYASGFRPRSRQSLV
jgi:hypothetical protein